MTQYEIIEMARQAGFEDFDKWCEHYPQETQRWCQRMEAFAKLVEDKATAREREACAKLADAFPSLYGETQELARCIRARGEA